MPPSLGGRQRQTHGYFSVNDAAPGVLILISKGSAMQRLSDGTPTCLEGWGVTERLPEMTLEYQWVSVH